MEEEEHTDRQLQIAELCKKLQKIKRNINDDDTDNINQIITLNSPETCLTYLRNLEKKGDPRMDHSLLNKLIDCYTQVFSSMPLGKYCQNPCYARMLVRFAELKAIQDVSEAQDNFHVARSHCQEFAFVHIAHAQFELSQGNIKKSTWILQRALQLKAKPTECLEAAMQNLKLGRSRLFSQENKENTTSTFDNGQESIVMDSDFGKDYKSDESGDSPLACSQTDQRNNSAGHEMPYWRSSANRKRAVAMPGRFPLVPRFIQEEDNSDEMGVINKGEVYASKNYLSRQISGSCLNTRMIAPGRQSTGDSDSCNLLNLKPSAISPEPLPWENAGVVDSTTTLMYKTEKKDPSKLEDSTCSVNQVLCSKSPELCMTYLTNLEKAGDPRLDSTLLAKLLDSYSRVFARLALEKYSKNECYARMLVKFAELKVIEDPDDAHDNFLVATTNSKAFAFVHIAYAQFLLSQGNVKKSYAILQKAIECNAKPTELLHTAMKNMQSGKKQLLLVEDKENITDPPTLTSAGNQMDVQDKEVNRCQISLNQVQQKPTFKDSPSEWKIPARINRYVSPEEKRPVECTPTPRLLVSIPTPSVSLPYRQNAVAQTPSYKEPCAASFATCVSEKPAVAPHTVQNMSHAPFLCTPQSKVSYVQAPLQTPIFSNDTITIKGRQFFILKMIGRGGSSKVYQVLDHRKQLYAVKYVNLEEADAQTVESYKNEIEYLNHLQQYSEQIIKLHDYEITNNCIYMLMECGNLDLNTWLRNRKSVNPLERKFYWRNMLEAVHTIHKHGIIHSDLKPANFVIVNASLKLIDFGIANRIQPDMTSIVKDSQVGTLNYMPPEAIKDTSSKAGHPSSKISPKGDVWSLGCILYCMTYGKTPFQSITNQMSKLHAIIDPSHEIDFPNIAEQDLLDVLTRCLVRNPKERISIAELLEHPYLQIQPQQQPEPAQPCSGDLKRILNELAALQSPNSIARAASNLAKMCNSGKKLDISECVKTSSQTSWKM
ncbi:dual specificity protein kinase Ttk isoform X2 [Denticeps clupeoides]|uniref:dual specificity protein kinase Ttk isoform X2 n=1 Tax=Denticeps clupeoides TaxID=299321 RepID=UPI0010A36557|nr:dual specificity protein kinase TTK isoform X2 [Denticeps clupeoides]